MTKNLGSKEAMRFLWRRSKASTPIPHSYPSPQPAPWLRPTGAWLQPPKKNILQLLLQSVKHRLS